MNRKNRKDQALSNKKRKQEERRRQQSENDRLQAMGAQFERMDAICEMVGDTDAPQFTENLYRCFVIDGMNVEQAAKEFGVSIGWIRKTQIASIAEKTRTMPRFIDHWREWREKRENA